MIQAELHAKKMAALAAMGFKREEPPGVFSDSFQVPGGRVRVTQTRAAMGTYVAVTVIHPSKTEAEEAIGRVFQEMDRVIDILNRYDSASALTYLNVEGSIERPPHELSQVVSLSRKYHDLSQGAFDVTVQPLVDLFRTGGPPDASADVRGSGDAGKPTDAQVRDALSLVDGRAVKVEPRSIALGKPGMGLTLDGIAKGYVVDVMAHSLRSWGIHDFIVNAGGDLRASGRREDGGLWRVGVQDPEKDGPFPEVVEVPTGAVATSGSYEIYFDGDRTRHHIVSGDTGTSPQPCQSVTVLAPTAMAADALATTVFVLGPERGMTFIDFLPDCACLIIDEANRQLRSKRWRSAPQPP